MSAGIDHFYRVLRHFRTLSLWAGGSALVPFAAGLVELSPPWPNGVVVTTAIVEVLTLAIVFQLMERSNRRFVSTTMVISAIFLCAISIAYLTMISLFVYRVETNGARLLKGFVCTHNALLVYGDLCPFPTMEEIRSNHYDAEGLWTDFSIAIVREHDCHTLVVGIYCTVDLSR